LSPKGKLVHLGLEGLFSTNALLDAATRFESKTILRNEIYRIALNEIQESTLKRTAENLSELAQWFEPDELGWDQPEILGALRLHSGCKVVHMPTYLKGLWAACVSIGSGEKEWVVEDCTSSGVNWEQRLAKFDTVVLCAGAGLFQNSIIEDQLPINLVRGQSIELTLDKTTFEHAMLCGKYVSPLLEQNRVLVGATHEFAEKPLSQENVKADLKQKSYPFASNIWDDASIDKITCGFRVQSDRGRYGRMPIIGRYDTPIHKNAWIFTGLSSRGLLYHGVFGDMLTKMILSLDEEELEHPDLDWWNKK
jgi:glycine/D-amino acid oxidase-like deaminating enzyme